MARRPDLRVVGRKLTPEEELSATWNAADPTLTTVDAERRDWLASPYSRDIEDWARLIGCQFGALCEHMEFVPELERSRRGARKACLTLAAQALALHELLGDDEGAA